MAPTGDPAHSPGMCPDQDLNWATPVRTWYFFYYGKTHINIKFTTLTILKICLLILERKRQRGREREKETSVWKRNIDWLPATHTIRNQTCNLGLCLDQESTPQPFGVWNDTPTNWATLSRALLNIYWFRGREREMLICCCTYFMHSVVDSHWYLPSSGIEPTRLVYQDKAPTNWTTQLGNYILNHFLVCNLVTLLTFTMLCSHHQYLFPKLFCDPKQTLCAH